ncbi:MAG: hypothetical protein ACYCZI_00555 [Metallibacterium scheffleri]
MLHDFGCDIDANHGSRGPSQQGTAITLAASDIQNVFVRAQGRAPGIAMQVLVPDRARLGRQVALASEFHDIDSSTSRLADCIGMPTNP